MAPRLLVICALLLGTIACRDGLVRAPVPDLGEAKESSCAIVKDHSRPLIVEWPASARGDLEARMRTGLVAVRYVGCTMQVLEQCSVAGQYRYAPFTPKEDRLVIRDTHSLFASLPLGAADLRAKLESKGELDLDMRLVGKYEAVGGDDVPELRGDCAEATHLVTGMTAGAFELVAGGAIEVGGAATLIGAGAKGLTGNARETLSRDGNFDACNKARDSDRSPPEGCGGVVRVEVVPVSVPACPSGTRSSGSVCVTERIVVPTVECPSGTSWDGEVCMGHASALDARHPFAGTWACSETAEINLTNPPSPSVLKLAGTTMASIEETDDGFAMVKVSAGTNSCSWRGKVSGSSWTALPGQSCSRLDGATIFLTHSTATVAGATSTWRSSGKYSRSGTGGQAMDGNVTGVASCTKL
jgi:hypothetical protein